MALTFSQYIDRVLFYMDNEYTNETKLGCGTNDLSDDEKFTIRSMVYDHYYKDNSPSNTANDIIDYLRVNKNWKEENIQ